MDNPGPSALSKVPLFAGLTDDELARTAEWLEVDEYEPGSVFGEMAFFDHRGRRWADVVCDSPVRVFSMFGTHFREMQQCMPEVAARLQRLFEERAARHAALGHA